MAFQFHTILLFLCLSTSTSKSEIRRTGILNRNLKMGMGNESVGMGMGAEKMMMGMGEGMSEFVEEGMGESMGEGMSEGMGEGSSEGMAIMGMGMGMDMWMGMGRGRGTSPAPSLAPTAPSTLTIAPTPAGKTFDTNAPSDDATTVSPTQSPIQSNIVRISDHFISFVAPLATRAPTKEEYDEMVQRITKWFETAVAAEYANENVSLVNVELFDDFKVYGINREIPPRPENFNIYINFAYADYIFSDDDDNENRGDLPAAADLFLVIRRSMTTDFILDVIRTYKGTPFESTNEIFLAALKK